MHMHKLNTDGNAYRNERGTALVASWCHQIKYLGIQLGAPQFYGPDGQSNSHTINSASGGRLLSGRVSMTVAAYPKPIFRDY